MRGFLFLMAFLAIANAAWVTLEWLMMVRIGSVAILAMALKIEIAISLIGGAALAGMAYLIGCAGDIELRLKEVGDALKKPRA